MTKPVDSMASRALGLLARWICRRPSLFIWSQAALFLAGIAVTVHWLEFDTNRDDLVGGEKRDQQNFRKFKQEFAAQDDLLALVESGDQEKNRQFVERLGRRIALDTNNLLTDLFYKKDLTLFGPKALLLAPTNELESLLAALKEYRPFMEQFTQASNFVSLFSLINSRLENATRDESEENKSLVKALPALGKIITGATDALRRPGAPPPPGVEAMFGGGPEAVQSNYLSFANGHVFLLNARAKDEPSTAAAIQKLRDLVAETQLEVPGVNVGVTGEPILDADEMAQSQRDSEVASVVSFFLCGLIFIYSYRETGRPLKAGLCLLVGLSYTMAFTTLVVGHLNILTITFAPILIGLAIDFGVHLITRFEEEMRAGNSKEAALEKAMAYTGLGILTGALTTAGAFLAMGLTQFQGIREMGIICGGGMMLCFIPMMTMLPALLLYGRQNAIDHGAARKPDRRAKIEESWLKRPVWVAGLTVVICVVAAVRVGRLYFNYNLLDMQSAGLSSVVYEEKLIHTVGNSSLFAVVVATNLPEAAALEEKILKLPSVLGIDSMTKILMDDPAPKWGMIRRIKEEIASIQFPPDDPEPVRIPELTRTLWSLQGLLGNASEETRKDEPKLAAEFDSLIAEIQEFRVEALRDDPGIQTRLHQYQSALFSEIRGNFDALRRQDDHGRVSAGDLPRSLRDRFIGATGRYLLQVNPRNDVWQRGPQAQFVSELRSVYPEVTGTPVQFYQYTTLLKESYQQAAVYALIAIAIMVLIHFQSLVCVVLALLPVAIGSLWLGGMMGWFDVPFNPANIMTLPLVIGIGVTNGIHILNRFAEERNPAVLGRSTGKAVLVSGLTAISGFGSLILAKHRGISSLGLVMSVGVATCMIAALTFLPALLSLMVKNGWMIKKPSADTHGPALGFEEPR